MWSIAKVWLWSSALCVGSVAAAEPDRVRFDFESGDMQGWRIVEGRFDDIVSDRRFYHNHPAVEYNKQGKFYLSTVEQKDGPSNDRMTGVVVSPVFVPAGAEMSLLICGGDYPDAYVALCTLDGKEVRHARGRRTEVMHRVTWQVPELVGRPVFLRIVDRQTGGWGHVNIDDFSAVGRIDQQATAANFAAIIRSQGRARLRARFDTARLEALAAAVDDLTRTFPDHYRGYRDRLDDFLRRVDALGDDMAGDADVSEQADKMGEQFDAFRREALLANPLVSRQPILFVVRSQYRSHYHAIDTLFHTGEFNPDRGRMHAELFQGGGALKTIDLAEGGRVATLVDVAEGVARDPDVHFDGRRIVFAMRRNVGEDYHIWQINADGTGLTQLTRAAGVSDFDPIYTPAGDVVFSSTREPKYNMCSRDIAANLFRMEADGANIHQIGKNNLFDNHASLMPDGRILYARWEYVDRNFGDAHGLWTVNPDGTNQAVYWGNNTTSPGAVFNPQMIPGTQQVLCVFGPHHDRLWGALAIIDQRLGLDGQEPVVRTWPPEAKGMVRSGGPFDCDEFAHRVKTKYEDPWPLSDKYFLVSRMTGQGEQMGIYLLDVFGNEVLLHTEGPGCYDPMPLAERRRPPAMASMREFTSGSGRFYVADVYQGSHMNGVARGSVQYLRVVESPEKRHWSPGAWFGQGYTAPGMNWHSLENKRILGTVPVEPDGSAHFSVPAETFVYFQLLDENGMMVQSMRSGASVHVGETVGCVGCHDRRRRAPPAPAGKTPLAAQRDPSPLNGWFGPARPFGYMAEVQPVWDAHCVRCHDYGTEGGKTLNLAGDRGITFNTSYNELWRKGYVRCVGAGPAEIQQAYSWGSHASKLAEVMRTGHANPQRDADIRLDRESIDRVITWIDLNAVYYPTYACAYPNSLTGRSPLDGKQLERLGQLTGVNFVNLRSHGGNLGPQVSFDRPELSPCLAGFTDRNDPKHIEALAIIRAGQRMLDERPRADMPSFRPCETDLRREEKYAQRRDAERRNRAAIRAGDRVYDSADEEMPRQ